MPGLTKSGRLPNLSIVWTDLTPKLAGTGKLFDHSFPCTPNREKRRTIYGRAGLPAGNSADYSSGLRSREYF